METRFTKYFLLISLLLLVWCCQKSDSSSNDPGGWNDPRYQNQGRPGSQPPDRATPRARRPPPPPHGDDPWRRDDRPAWERGDPAAQGGGEWATQAGAGWGPAGEEEEGPLPREGAGPGKSAGPSPTADAGTRRVEAYCAAGARHRALLLGTCGALGAGAGLAASNAVVHRPLVLGPGGFLLGVLLGLWKSSALGDLLRAAALALLWAVARSKRFRHGYPLFGQLRACFWGDRRPFPPGAEDPWLYQPRPPADGDPDPVAFSMTKAVLACALGGAFAGWAAAKAISFFLLPTWLLALGGLAGAVLLATLKNAAGDFFRCGGMKAVAFAGLLLEVDRELLVARKAAALLRLLFRRLLFFDRKYRVSDRLFDGLQQVLGRATAVASQMRESMDDAGARRHGGEGGGEGRGPEGWGGGGAGGRRPPGGQGGGGGDRPAEGGRQGQQGAPPPPRRPPPGEDPWGAGSWPPQQEQQWNNGGNQQPGWN